jgi:TonB-linked SusC/RagA family outer membrane protein
VRAANGVVLITTKRGKKDQPVKVSYTGSYTFQVPSGLPRTVDAIDLMTLANEKTMNEVNGGTLRYGKEDFDAYRDGTKKSADWYDLLFSRYAPQTQHDVSIRGGGDKSSYYVGFGYFYQDGFFKTNVLNYNKYTLRSNITTTIVRGLDFNLNLSGLIDKQQKPYTSTSNILRNYWRQSALMAPYADPEGTLLRMGDLTTGENPLASIDPNVSGYERNANKWVESSMSLKYDFPFVKGLSAKALFSFDYNIEDNTTFRREYMLYSDYDITTESYPSTVYSKSTPSNIDRNYDARQQALWQAQLNYANTFGDHHVSGMLVYEGQRRKGDNFYAARNLTLSSIPYLFAGEEAGQVGSMDPNQLYEYTNDALAGKFTYDYQSKYLAEFQFRYDGSSMFAHGHQWGFFPSGSIGWRVSEEPFIKNTALKFINNLKLRASYGVLGDDGSSAYQWVSGYTYPANGGTNYHQMLNPGYMFNGEFVYAAANNGIPNTDITWYTSKTFDAGVDFEAWNGLFGFSFDYFNRHRNGLLATRLTSLPTVVGAAMPEENLNSDRQFGAELVLTHRNKVGDFTYNVKASGSITRCEYLTAGNQPKSIYGNRYDYWRNNNLNHRYQGIEFGQTYQGQYQSWKQIWASALNTGRDVVPGDYIYEDWNGDGVIDANDYHPIVYNTTPWLNYSLSFNGTWHGIDLYLLFQGSAMGSVQYQEQFLEPMWGDTNAGTMEQFMNRWHPTDPSADPFSPATKWVKGYYAYTGHDADANSTFAFANDAYLRLKTIEVGYTLPKVHKLRNFQVRVFFNAYNALTFTKVKVIDPEHPNDSSSNLYPLNKTYTLGLTLTL